MRSALFVLLTALAGLHVAYGWTQLSSSVMTFYNSEFVPHYGQAISQCSLLLRRAKEHGSRTVNFVPTHYWMDDSAVGSSAVCNPDNWFLPGKVDYYCTQWQWDSPCLPFNATTIRLFQTGFQSCLQEAYDMGFNVLVSPHIDDGSRKGYWRNFFRFDPLAKDAANNSYYDIMLQPIVTAAKNVLKDRSRTFWLGLQGEMGATLVAHPQSWINIADQIRKQFTSTNSKIYLGVLLAYAFIPGVITRANGTYELLPITPLSKYAGGGVLPFAQWPERNWVSRTLPAYQTLMTKHVDFYGISNYARAPVDPKPKDLEYGVKMADLELAQLGINLTQQLTQGGKKLIWAEFGLGGGRSKCGDVIATDPYDAGYGPDRGMTSSYSTPNLDPWFNPSNASKPTIMQEYRRRYHAAALKVLAQGGLRYPTSGAFLWSIVSWDVQGIHPASSSRNGSFADPVIIEMIKQHNKKG